MYVTLELDDSGCRIHRVFDGNEEIVTNERYVVMRRRWLPGVERT